MKKEPDLVQGAAKEGIQGSEGLESDAGRGVVEGEAEVEEKGPGALREAAQG